MENEPSVASFAVQELPASPECLKMQADFPGILPEKLFDYWTKPGLLCLWWPPEAEIEPREGGKYHLAWPRSNWHLRGRYLAFERGKHLAFTWKWDADPKDASPKQVSLSFVALDGGTQILLTHGPYTDSSEDAEARAGHLEGWTHFLSQLHQACSEA
ncbi:MAG TPA: SRPBCC domain-containing protein [Ktedonobacterales bacterium]